MVSFATSEEAMATVVAIASLSWCYVEHYECYLPCFLKSKTLSFFWMVSMACICLTATRPQTQMKSLSSATNLVVPATSTIQKHVMVVVAIMLQTAAAAATIVIDADFSF